METETYEYSTSIFFWIKGIIEITQRDIMICYPNTILWVFPNGRSRDIVPLRNISGVSVERYTNLFNMIVGIFLDMIGVFTLMILEKSLFSSGSFFSNLGPGIFSFFVVLLILLVPGTLLILSSMRKTLVILCSGDEFDIDVPFFEANKIFDIQDCLNDALDYEADKYDINLRKRELADEIGDAVGRAIDKRRD